MGCLLDTVRFCCCTDDFIRVISVPTGSGEDSLMKSMEKAVQG